MRFQNKVVVVTGGSKGIGEATVKQLLSEGAFVCNVDVMEPSIKKDSKNLFFYPCDLTDALQVEKTIAQIISEHKTIDGLFANAGKYHAGSLEDTTPQEFQTLFEVNVLGVFHVLQNVLRHMKMKKKGSVVINGSDQALVGKPFSAAYGATKGAVIQLMKSTALMYAKDGIRVNGVCPGSIRTGLYAFAMEHVSEKYFSGDEEKLRTLDDASHPMGRIGTAQEVAHVVAFLLSDESSFVTGSAYSVDGGLTAQ